jgi:hypothetical protein
MAKKKDEMYDFAANNAIGIRCVPQRKFVWKVPNGEKIVSMLEFKGDVIIATDKCIYIVVGDTVKPMKMTDIKLKYPIGSSL